MLKACEDISSTKKRLKIEVPAETIEAEFKKALQNVQKKVKLPGFRPGKAPMTLIEKRYGKDAEAEVLDKLIPEHYVKALKEADIMPVSKPEMEEHIDFQRNAPLSMTIVVEVRPKIENLSYEGIPVKGIAVEVKEEEVNAVISNLAEEKATYESVDEATGDGDLVTVDYTAKESEDGEPSVAKDVVFKIGSGPYPAEFFEGLKGRKKDDDCEITASFPEDSKTPFPGKTPKFNVKIKDVKRRNIPEIDDEFAKDLGLESLQILKERVTENLLASKNREADMIKQKELMDKLLDSHRFDVPEGLLNSEIGGIIRDIRSSGKDDRADEILSQEIRPDAEKRVRASLLLEIIGEKEAINVTEDELKREVVSLAQRFYTPPENVVKFYVERDGSLEGLKHTVFEKKVLNFLLGKAAIVEGEA